MAGASWFTVGAFSIVLFESPCRVLSLVEICAVKTGQSRAPTAAAVVGGFIQILSFSELLSLVDNNVKDEATLPRASGEYTARDWEGASMERVCGLYIVVFPLSLSNHVFTKRGTAWNPVNSAVQ